MLRGGTIESTIYDIVDSVDEFGNDTGGGADDQASAPTWSSQVLGVVSSSEPSGLVSSVSRP